MNDQLHWDAEEFRRHGYAVIDWVADYLRDVAKHPVRSQVAPGEIRSRVPAAPPERGESFETLLHDVDDIVLPGITHWQSPNFFAYFPANATGPSILGDLLSSGMGVQGMLWETSPAATELEMAMCDWFVQLLGLPDHFRFDGPGGGVIQDSASSATLCALLAARERATAAGASAQDLRIYASEQAHSSVEKAVRIAGLGAQALRLIPLDEEHALDATALGDAAAEDAANGLRPCMVVATVGTTSSTAIDPVLAIADICQQHGAWLHVDAALAGSAAVCPELRWIHQGVERADSYCVNPHKWLLTNFDCDLFWVRDRRSLISALSVLPEYLRNAASESGAVVDYRDWQIPLGRRFRALKLWFVVRTYGVEGLQEHVRRTVGWAQELGGWVAADARWELLAPTTLNLVCMRAVAGDEATRAVMERINDSGAAYLTHTKLNGRFVLRAAVGAVTTQREHVVELWRLLNATLDEVLAA